MVNVLFLGIGTAILLFFTVELITFILFNTTNDYKSKTTYFIMGQTFGIMGYLLLFIFILSSSDILNSLLKFSPSSYPEIARSSSILISLLLYTVHIIFEFKFNLEENNQKNEYIIYLIVGVLGYLFYLYGLAAGVR
ncbi:MAG: hypothetical protein AMQ74_00996 [Candidatus Methanofastidiosum methylothiophilum]|jgi:hypothetical protein|uniref:Uncharacterized protein n=1 Tax=Candidatus Methanofastidiosum methylothiophilum TaxID=1705564 RepID=A0A150J3J2_9EURY|nr:MAG: hypothetical protein AMQ74_00996 [Candidatus Methanofastidiosum methylthiophilus]